jgi:hypothetical protein
VIHPNGGWWQSTCVPDETQTLISSSEDPAWPIHLFLFTAMSLRNGSHLPTTQCACADFVNFATQRNGGRGREKDTHSKISASTRSTMLHVGADISHLLRQSSIFCLERVKQEIIFPALFCAHSLRTSDGGGER